MIILFTAVLLLFLVTITIFYRDYSKQKIKFNKKVSILRNNLALLALQSENQAEKVKLSEDFTSQLKQKNHFLNRSIYDVNYDLFSILFDKN